MTVKQIEDTPISHKSINENYEQIALWVREVALQLAKRNEGGSHTRPYSIRLTRSTGGPHVDVLIDGCPVATLAPHEASDFCINLEHVLNGR